MALVFLPVLGGVVVASGRMHDPEESRFVQGYRKALATLLKRPGLTLLGSLVLIILIYTAYGRFNHGVEFFPVLNRIRPGSGACPGRPFHPGADALCVR